MAPPWSVLMPSAPTVPTDDLGAPNNGAPDDRVYDPTAVEVTRGRQQGLGMGAADLARQRDVVAPDASENEDEDDEA